MPLNKGNLRHNSAASVAFNESMIHIGLWDAALTWYFPDANLYLNKVSESTALDLPEFAW